MQVGVCALVGCYMVLGAFMFAALEAESQMEQAVVARDIRLRFARRLWNVTLHTNVLFGEEWKKQARRLVDVFQDDVVINVRNGYTGTNVGDRVWTFSSALMYSLSVFTTLGTSLASHDP